MPYHPRIGKTERTWIPLEHYPEFAALIGRIIGQFALTEDRLPYLLHKMLGTTIGESLAILGVFRSFSNRIDVLDQLIPHQPAGDRVLFTYFKERVAQSNGIRNKYAHAAYGMDNEGLHIATFSGRYNSPSKLRLLRLAEIKRDENQMSLTNTEIMDFLMGNRIPRSLWKQLPEEYREAPRRRRSRPDAAPESDEGLPQSSGA